MSDIAPLDYERWAVLVSPLLVPGAQQVEAKPPPRHAEQTGPVSAAPSGTGSRASGDQMGLGARPAKLPRRAFERDSEHPLNGPHPTDLNWFFRLPNETRDSMRDQPAIEPRRIVRLYEHPEKTRGTTVRVSG